MDRLNFNHLYYFYIVANEGSIKDAALKLHVSQPTISDQIKLLEEHFNCLLFERKNRSLFLTEQGKLALKYAQQIFDLGSELTNRLRNNVEGPKKALDIGITHMMGHYFLYDSILPLFKSKELSVNVKENERHLLLADLEEEKIDMVFTDSKEGLTNNMDAYRIGVNRTFAIAHKDFVNSKKTFPKCLNSIPFFNYTNDTFLKYEIDLFFSKSGISPRVIGEGDDIDLFQVITEQALAFTIVPEVAKNRICRNKDVVVLGELDEFQTYVWGIIKKSYKGPGYKLLSKGK
ncbi:LysR family transcriptional regulator [Halobacteriovorax sp. HLS]|uniref:LysR family transcriptional regulator n=1 Tax=Halobacteriovorax sp. HLS TaxID=2234000 RepID=UPI000FD8ADAA|nr:LysR family transcriptional regulator [Halobacteriovorax sp. HLS]